MAETPLLDRQALEQAYRSTCGSEKYSQKRKGKQNEQSITLCKSST